MRIGSCDGDSAKISNGNFTRAGKLRSPHAAFRSYSVRNRGVGIRIDSRWLVYLSSLKFPDLVTYLNHYAMGPVDAHLLHSVDLGCC
jgi:hypothetical protein